MKELQALLRSAGYNVTADGIFGAVTKKTVKLY
ncbi:peptidoglycan-binding protein [Domibacillus aminovorans]